MTNQYVEIPDLFDEDDEARELTDDEIKLLRPFSALPKEIQDSWHGISTNAATTEQVALPPDVVEPFRARGEGWERVMEGVLREWLRDHAA